MVNIFHSIPQLQLLHHIPLINGCVIECCESLRGSTDTLAAHLQNIHHYYETQHEQTLLAYGKADATNHGQMQINFNPQELSADEKDLTTEDLAKLWTLKFFIDSDIPFLAADSHAFKNMMKYAIKAGPTFQPPGSHAIKRKLMEEGKKLEVEVKQELQQCKNIAISSDKWTAPTGESFYALTCKSQVIVPAGNGDHHLRITHNHRVR